MEINTYEARLVVHHCGKTFLHFGRYLDGAALNIELPRHDAVRLPHLVFGFISFHFPLLKTYLHSGMKQAMTDRCGALPFHAIAAAHRRAISWACR